MQMELVTKGDGDKIKSMDLVLRSLKVKKDILMRGYGKMTN